MVTELHAPPGPQQGHAHVQLASDLHLEFLNGFPSCSGIPAHPDADLLVLAGDIGTVEDVVRYFARWPVPVVWVLGNHEFYRGELADVRERARRLTRDTSIVLLDNEALLADDLRCFEAWFERREDRLRGLRILGTTLWTDYEFIEGNPERSNRSLRMAEVGLRLNDHRLIRLGDRLFTPADALAEHMVARTWLDDQLAQPFNGRTLVITHHGPDRMSVHPRFAGNSLNSAFVSQLPELLAETDVWVHGHVHDSFSYVAEGCRVIANPRGYLQIAHSEAGSASLKFENSNFNPSLLVDV